MAKQKRQAKKLPEEAAPQVPWGYDGRPPVIREARDLGGNGKPQIFYTYRDDALATLLHRKSIEDYQAEAGRRLQGDHEMFERTQGSCLDFSGGGSGASDMACLTAIDAARRASLAWKQVHWRAREALSLLLLANKGLQEIGTLIKKDRRGVAELIHIGLDDLAAHYGLMTPQNLARPGHKC